MELACQRAKRELVLSELRSAPIPAGIVFDDAFVAAEIGTYLWGSSGLWFWADSSATLVPLCSDLMHASVAVVRSATGREITVIERTGKKAAKTLGPAHCSRWDGTVAEEVLKRVRKLAASRVTRVRGDETQLRFLQTEAGNRARVLAVSVQDGSSTTVAIADEILRIGFAISYAAVANGKTVLIAEQMFPYRIVTVDGLGRQMRLLEPTAQLTAQTRAALLTGWIALPPVPVEPGVLLVLADPTTDNRLLLTASGDGVFSRAVELDVAIAFLAVDPLRQRLVAVRDIGRRELVLYSWRWRGRP